MLNIHKFRIFHLLVLSLCFALHDSRNSQDTNNLILNFATVCNLQIPKIVTLTFDFIEKV